MTGLLVQWLLILITELEVAGSIPIHVKYYVTSTVIWSMYEAPLGYSSVDAKSQEVFPFCNSLGPEGMS